MSAKSVNTPTTGIGVTPIQQKTLAELAFDILSRQIISGAIAPGERLVESELANELGISRAPVREALSELVRQGLAYDIVRRGTFVTQWTKRDLWEVATLRANLEALAIQLAVPHLTEEDLEIVHRTAHRMEEVARNGDTERLIEMDSALHDMLVQRCPHRRLQALLNDLRPQLKIFRLVTGKSDLAAHPDTQHMVLFRALRERDPELAYRTVYEHFIKSAERALAGLRDEDEVVVPQDSSAAPEADHSLSEALLQA